MNENVKWVAAAVAVVGLSIGGIVYFSQREKAAPAQQPVIAAPAEPALPEAPAIEVASATTAGGGSPTSRVLEQSFGRSEK